MQDAFMLDANIFLEIFEEAIALGKERGKVTGDRLDEEFFEIANKKGIKLNYLGKCQDKDLLAGNLREEGYTIINLGEE